MTTFTVKQALAIAPEELSTMTLEDVQAVADTLATSADKRASRKLDLVQGTLNARKQEAKKSGDKEAEQEVKAVENSVKKVARTRKPKAKAPEQEELPLDDEQEEPEQEEEEPKKKVAPKKRPTPKAKKADKPEQEVSEQEEEEEAPKKKAPTPKKGKQAKEPDEVSKLKAQLAQLEQENSKLKAEVFPAKIEREGKAPLVAQKLPTVQDVQKVLMSRPYELFLYVHEGLDDKPTAFTVLYMNEEILVLLDRSREQNTTLTLKVKNMKAKSVKIDNRECPYIFYLSEKEDQE